ncbi:helix-turn-helix domain-containing protein [Virgibacillus oceani]|uniref:Transcriptional regulator n=1 Tax=Virgibacillus oceani TaxID=1479511 RepID=A0A917M8V9_9BACI|nr:XRE family transcriptional regulator [Virgibacillus oceani]GGG85107.1 transcriptional regulator [Virgibacillus oceani]
MFKSVFNGERLKIARTYRGKTINDLAELLGVTKQMISKYEHGKSVPSSEMLLKLEQYLLFPRKFFFEEGTDKVQVGNTYFRSLRTTPKRDLEAQKLKLLFLSKIYRFVADYINFPVVNLPDLSLDALDSMEVAAKEVRKYWGLGQEPISNMVRLLEANGLIVNTSRTNITSIDAFTQQQRYEKQIYYFVVLGNDKGNGYRRQFDAAHELGHVLLHDPYIDLTQLEKDEEKELERQANQFAAALLLPKDAFTRDVSMHPRDLNHYLYLKKKWHVSIGAMVVRAHNLGIIEYNQYHYLQRQISSKGWRKEEPFDKDFQPASPILLKKAITMILENKKLSGSQILDTLAKNYDLSLNAYEFEDLVGLERGTLEKYYSKQQPKVIVEMKKSL